ncbi:MAG: subunit of tubulin prefoldin [Candelina mexicana]|nr:MAG: subunit of tubulin prefoldin [Candelina mexicana]
MAESPKDNPHSGEKHIPKTGDLSSFDCCTVDIASLSAPQLSQVKKQLDEELEHLTNSFRKLRAAQSRFQECLKSIDKGISSLDEDMNTDLSYYTTGVEKPVLVPLTTSLYVRGTISDTQHVIVDVGTGFYVEKSTSDAPMFYQEKVEELEGNLKNLETIVQQKSNNLRVVEDVLRQKVINNGN